MSDYISQTKIRLTAGLLFSALIGTTALATEVSEPNVFNADMSNPDLTAAVSAFEQVCMPFVLHETDMTRENDKRHMAKLMQSRGYSFVSSELKPNYVVVEPHQEVWRPPSQAINPNGITIVHQTGENYLISDIIPPVYETKTYEDEIYAFQMDSRLSVNLRWNYLSQKDPGKSCAISLERTAISREDFVESMIAKDTDWRVSTSKSQTEPKGWSQCIEKADGDYLFKVSQTKGRLKISMKRSDFYELKLCRQSQLYQTQFLP